MGNVRYPFQSLACAKRCRAFVTTQSSRRWADDHLQGAKANMKRERNAKDTKTAKSQTKSVRNILLFILRYR